ncbi:MAG: PQQ-dependent sugar dehydrogenase [Opitutales bacterium]
MLPTPRFPLLLFVAGVLFSGTSLLLAQNRFPGPIPEGDFAVRLLKFATLPNSFGDVGARVQQTSTDPSGRLFANDQRGPLYHISGDGTVSLYLDLRDPAYSSYLNLRETNEGGFTGWVFHPDFFNSGTEGYGRLYTIFSSNNTSVRAPDFDPGGGTNHHTVLLEWQTDDPNAIPFSPGTPAQPAGTGLPFRELMRFKQPFGNHNSGIIAFNPYAEAGDPERTRLYIAMGDAGSGNDPQENAQNPSNPYGAILRIDPIPDNTSDRYDIVLDNVLAQDAMTADTLDEIYAYGLRNPQWFSWDASTDALYSADIGQNAVEELNLIVNGGHYGWDLREGSFDFEIMSGETTTDLIDPVAEYDHSGDIDSSAAPTGGRAITCGEVIRGTGINALDGMLPLADFPTGNLLLLDVDNALLQGGNSELRAVPIVDEDGASVSFLELIAEEVEARELDDGLSRVDARYSVGTPGEIYVSNKRDGVIRRLVIVPEMALAHDVSGDSVTIDYIGRLQWRALLEAGDWEDVEPQPASPWTFAPIEPQGFFRTESN